MGARDEVVIGADVSGGEEVGGIVEGAMVGAASEPE